MSARKQSVVLSPFIGHLREDFRSGLRSYLVEHHQVPYRVEGKAIRVLRIVHVRTDPANWLLKQE
jgi:plasmid stabilization system protein ParE